MPKVHHPYNALDTLKYKVQEQLGQHGISMDWDQSAYCDQTFILMVRMGSTEIEFNVRFYAESYEMTSRFPDTTSGENADRFIRVFREKLDDCVYY
jgi:hypothetical protein